MNFRLLGKSDWLRIVNYVRTLEWQRDGKQVAYRVAIEEFDPKTAEQNAQQHVWYSLAEKQLGEDDAEGYRAHCKAYFGIPILCRDSEEYREAYDRFIRPLPYEQKLAMMRRPIDFPVTRGMNKKQLSEYLDRCYEYFTGLGVRLEDNREAA